MFSSEHLHGTGRSADAPGDVLPCPVLCSSTSVLAFKLQSTGSRQPTDYPQLFGENKPVGRRLVFAVSGSAIPGENSKDSATGGGEGMKEREKKKEKCSPRLMHFVI